jgi:hypothetical protein
MAWMFPIKEEEDRRKIHKRKVRKKKKDCAVKGIVY